MTLLDDCKALAGEWGSFWDGPEHTCARQLRAIIAKHEPGKWQCQTCGKIVEDDELCEPNEDYPEFHHLDIRGMTCGPVERRKGGEG